MRNLLFCLGILFVTTAQANANLVLRLAGETGSNVISYEASGSVTVTQGFSSLSSSLGLAPDTTGVWTSSFDNNLGDILRNFANANFNDNLVLGGGGVSYRKNGVEFGIIDLIDLDPTNTAGGDDIELDPTNVINYPSLVAGDILSWVGSGTFVLEDGETFDTLFVGTGTFQNPIDGGFYQVIIEEGRITPVIPEPTSMALLGMGLLGAGCVYRRRRVA